MNVQAHNAFVAGAADRTTRHSGVRVRCPVVRALARRRRWTNPPTAHRSTALAGRARPYGRVWLRVWMRVWGRAWPAGAAASTCRAGLGPPATSGNPTDREHIDGVGRASPALQVDVVADAGKVRRDCRYARGAWWTPPGRRYPPVGWAEARRRRVVPDLSAL